MSIAKSSGSRLMGVVGEMSELLVVSEDVRDADEIIVAAVSVVIVRTTLLPEALIAIPDARTRAGRGPERESAGLGTRIISAESIKMLVLTSVESLKISLWRVEVISESRTALSD